MPRIIVGTCKKEAACVDVCPVDAIEEGDDQYFINPDTCIDCAACESECPHNAIYEEDEVPDEYQAWIKKNADHFA